MKQKKSQATAQSAPRLEASIQHKGVNDIVFEYEKISDSSNPTSNVLPAAHPEDKETESEITARFQARLNLIITRKN